MINPPDPDKTKTRMLGGPDTKPGMVQPPDPEKSRRARAQ